MRTYLIIGLIGSALLLAGNTALQKYEAVKTSNATLSKELKDLQAEIDAANDALLDLDSDLKLERALQVELHQKQDLLSNQLDQSEAIIKRLKRENKELSDWAANDLPSTAQRMRQRPAITGASDYQNWLSSRNSMHPERYESTEQRRPTERR